MNKLKIGDLVMLHYLDTMFDRRVVKVVEYCEVLRVFVVDLREYVEGKYIATHTCNGMFVDNNYLYLHGTSSYSLVLLDNSLNRLLYPELTPNNEGYLV